MRVKQGRSIDAGTQVLLGGVFHAALPVLLRQPVFCSQQLVCKLLCVCKALNASIRSQNLGVLDVDVDCRQHGYTSRQGTSASVAEQFASWVRRYSGLVNSISIVLEWAEGEGGAAIAATLQGATAHATSLSAAAAGAVAGRPTAYRSERSAAVAAAPEAAVDTSGAGASSPQAQHAKDNQGQVQRHVSQQAPFRLQAFSVHNAGNSCPKMLQHLPATHLRRLEIEFSSIAYMTERTWKELAAAIRHLQGLESLAVVAPEHGSSRYSSSLLTDIVPCLAGLTKLILSGFNKQLLQDMPSRIVELGLGCSSTNNRNSCDCIIRPDADHAHLQLQLTHLTALTQLPCRCLHKDDQLPLSLQEVTTDACYDVTPLLGLTRLRALALGSGVHRFGEEDDSFGYDDSDDDADGWVHYHRDDWGDGRRRHRHRDPVVYEGVSIQCLSRLSSMTELTELRLSYNRVEMADLDASTWHTLQALKSLYLSHTPSGHYDFDADVPIRLGQSITQAMSQLTNLTRLEIDVGCLLDEVGRAVEYMTSLQELSLKNLWETGGDVEPDDLAYVFGQLTGLEQLRRLECNMVILTDAAKALAS